MKPQSKCSKGKKFDYSTEVDRIIKQFRDDIDIPKAQRLINKAYERWTKECPEEFAEYIAWRMHHERP